jgi:hypothetical protein
MKNHKWILSGIAALALIIYACTPTLMDEKILSVENIQSEIILTGNAQEKIIEGYDKVFTFVSNSSWCTVSGDVIRVEQNPSSVRQASVTVKWKNDTIKTILIKQGLFEPIGGSISFWTKNSKFGTITVTISSWIGRSTPTPEKITRTYSSNTECGRAGCATFWGLPDDDRYDFSATATTGGKVYEWSSYGGAITVSNSCLVFELID